MVKKRCTFKNLEENLKKPGRYSKNSINLEEIQKTWRKFLKNLWPTCLSFNTILLKNFRRVRKANHVHAPIADNIEDIEIPQFIKRYTGNNIDEKFLLADSENVPIEY